MWLNINNNTEKLSYLDDLSLDLFESNKAKVYIKNNIQEMNIYFAKDKNFLLNLLEWTKTILKEMRLINAFEHKWDIHRFIALKWLIKLKEMWITDLEEWLNYLTLSASSIEAIKLPFWQEHNVFIYDNKDLMVEDLIKEMKDNNITLEKVIDNLLLNEEFSDLTLPYQPKFDYIKDLVEKKLKSDGLKNGWEIQILRDLEKAWELSEQIKTSESTETEYSLTNEEKELAKHYFKIHDEIFRLEFDNTIELLKEKIERITTDKFLPLMFKAIIIMKENGAKSFDEISKLDK